MSNCLHVMDAIEIHIPFSLVPTENLRNLQNLTLYFRNVNIYDNLKFVHMYFCNPPQVRGLPFLTSKDRQPTINQQPRTATDHDHEWPHILAQTMVATSISN